MMLIPIGSEDICFCDRACSELTIINNVCTIGLLATMSSFSILDSLSMMQPVYYFNGVYVHLGASHLGVLILGDAKP